MHLINSIYANLLKIWASNYWLRSLIFNLLIWGSAITIRAWGSYLDNFKPEEAHRFIYVWMSGVENDFPLFLLSSCLFPLFQKYPHFVANASNIGWIYISLSIVYFPLYMLLRSFANWKRFNEHLHYSGFIEYVLSTRNSSLFSHFAFFVGTLTAVIALRIWHESKVRQASMLKIQTDNLKLNLALEQQKLHSLRQQLEPHFIFNALNGISALVRSNEQTIALDGIQRLSELLRYALNASNKNWVSMKDELDFIRDYLALQQLRYGDRLEVTITGDEPAILHGDCLPLLLQPLIENALRHDLDCHEEHSKISVRLSLDEDQVKIQIHNRLYTHAVKNPGLGLGLSQARIRLEMMYKGKASLQISESAHDFALVITMPLYQPEL